MIYIYIYAKSILEIKDKIVSKCYVIVVDYEMLKKLLNIIMITTEWDLL